MLLVLNNRSLFDQRINKKLQGNSVSIGPGVMGWLAAPVQEVFGDQWGTTETAGGRLMKQLQRCVFICLGWQ